MIGSFLTRGLVMVFGYAYPAYECYKAVEKNKPEMQQLRFWCQYWILVAALTIFERVGDAFASWVPLYSEAKLAFFIYLWFPKTRGTTYVYDSFFRPYVAKHENEIDRNLIELRTKAGDMAVIYCRKAVSYGQTRITEILQFVALQSTPKPQPKVKKQAEEEEQKQPDLKTTSQAASNPQARLQSKKPQLLTKEPISSTKPLSSSPRKQLQQQQQQQTEIKEAKASVSQTKLTTLSPPGPPPSPSTATKPNSDPPQPLSTEEEKAAPIVAASPQPASAIQRASSAKETIMEETLRVTRGSLRKARSTGVPR
ncbi:PREDICTED: HVA22-like protein h [Camelina sativa]|uniref:HVA22-like protein n=1 Tax=Camelina sativa TaxID=90675 RepID=A0ABM0VQI6_CAMSA|nr:PREDICTED: HVA22-like protein h [Camelina sativa]XP_010459676.1 PREDICTED: HVA22-like protein h [Camelina sativa]